MNKLLFLLSMFLISASAMAFTVLQNSTSVGYYRDYLQSGHYPIYQSWSVNGFYANGTQANLEFYLNNDFAVNQWLFQPTQVQFTIPLSSRFERQPERQSKIKLGRQLFIEGFDFAQLDGVQAPIYWSAEGGFSPILGYLQSPDPEQLSNNNTPIAGFSIWQKLGDFRFRGGFTAREIDYSTRFIFASVAFQSTSLIWDPLIFVKEELFATDMKFNQSVADLVLTFSDKFSGRVEYANLDPRPINHKDQPSYVYSLFAITPIETASFDLNWGPSEKFNFNLGAQRGFYNTAYRKETSDRQDLSMDFQIGLSHVFSPSLIRLYSYGGEVSDFGLRYIYNRSVESKYQLEADFAYVKKVNQIEGWVQHLRGGYETLFSSRAKIFFAVEAERNQYYVFDVRALAYVTNYL